MKYLKFNLPIRTNKKGSNFFQKIVSRTLKIILPVSNSDFENKIDDVKYWLVEFDEENIPNREIGLDENDNVILKMPYKKNYGFWTDNELLYDDFISRFSAIEVDSITFNTKWNSFDLK
ncbi:hypothetical protein [Chryseobacterium sp. P1-3]|uniref:hypothetical protein n=1 Tax=Chryseobacterium sp. (strain P1-3) TaxID=1517683 RepID=UPI000679CCEF|nr:hypothetical protein [Chryseobacterium sp. P1-3]